MNQEILFELVEELARQREWFKNTNSFLKGSLSNANIQIVRVSTQRNVAQHTLGRIQILLNGTEPA